MEFKLANGWINSEGEFIELEPGDTHYLALKKLNPEIQKGIETTALNEGWIRVAYLDLNGKELNLQAKDINKLKRLIKENIRLINKADLDNIVIEWDGGYTMYGLPNERIKLLNFITTDALVEALEKLTKKKVILENRTNKSVVGIVFKPGYILLGKAIADDRDGWLCFPGGGVDGEESLMGAAKREVREETNLFVEPFKQIEILQKGEQEIYFIVCSYINGEIQPNSEFKSMNWYGLKELPWNEIYPQNRELLKNLLS